MKTRLLKIKYSLHTAQLAADGSAELKRAGGSLSPAQDMGGKHPVLIELARLLGRRTAAELITKAIAGLDKGRSG